MGALISVIVPVYNVEKYLRKCVDSLLNQTYRNLEIILVDDGSPDGSGAICDEYAALDSRIKVIHQVNGGLSAARNTGLNYAAGEYIAFVDSDDWVSEKFIQELFENASPQRLVICNLVFWVSENEQSTSLQITKNENISLSDFWFRTTEDVCAAYIVACSKLYHKSWFENVRFPVGLQHEDEAILHQIVDQCKEIRVIAAPLYFYRSNHESIMGQKFNIKRLDLFTAWAKRLQYFHKKKMYIAEDRLSNRFWLWYKDQIILFSGRGKERTSYNRAIKSFRMAFGSLVRAQSISKYQKLSVLAMFIHPKAFRMMWSIIAFFRKCMGR